MSPIRDEHLKKICMHNAVEVESIPYSSLCFTKYPLEDPVLVWWRLGEPGLDVDRPSFFSGVVGNFIGVSFSRAERVSIVVFS